MVKKKQGTYLKRSSEACNDLANVWYVGDRLKTSIIQWSTCFCAFAKLSWQIYEFFLATDETKNVQDSASKANKDGHPIESDCFVLFLASSAISCHFASSVSLSLHKKTHWIDKLFYIPCILRASAQNK